MHTSRYLLASGNAKRREAATRKQVTCRVLEYPYFRQVVRGACMPDHCIPLFTGDMRVLPGDVQFPGRGGSCGRTERLVEHCYLSASVRSLVLLNACPFGECFGCQYTVIGIAELFDGTKCSSTACLGHVQL